ncbi:MAG: hypothetical protein C4521_00560 [Actinobacteria bacterium]|nr:MAG: hypothetical protein C4521_00560 [Actinomycetota bacterium]
MQRSQLRRIESEHRVATVGGLGLFIAIASLTAVAVLFISRIPGGEAVYSLDNARVPCGVSVWFGLLGLLVLSSTRLAARRLIRSIEDGTARPNLLRLGSAGYLKRVTVAIWAECAIGTVMGLGHWVGGMLAGAGNVLDIAPFYILSMAAAAIFVPRLSTWLQWLGASEREQGEEPGTSERDQGEELRVISIQEVSLEEVSGGEASVEEMSVEEAA